jgi:hypothetical protein
MAQFFEQLPADRLARAGPNARGMAPREVSHPQQTSAMLKRRL